MVCIVRRTDFRFDMSLTPEDFQALALQCQLTLTDDELAQVQSGFEALHQGIAAVLAADTAAIEPLLHPQAQGRAPELVLHADRADPHIDRALNQRSAPEVVDGLFIVPRVIE